MQIFPTRTAADVTIAGVFVLALGIVLRQPAVLGWGGAVLFAVAAARTATVLAVTRLRAAGLEMVWRAPKRTLRAVRTSSLTFEAELRNRDRFAVRFGNLRAIASSQLVIEASPTRGEIPGGGRAVVTITVTAPRAGNHGIHGVALEVEGYTGLFEVPLAFGSPLGIEVFPRSFGSLLASARGGRSRLGAEASHIDRRPGEGSDMRELRDHVPGDPFKRIAWKASARRGKLLVRDFERDERDVVWVVLDASVELWAGVLGRAPLDAGIDDLAALAQRHIARGDRVGVAVVASRVRTMLAPATGASHVTRIAAALASGASLYDQDRSDLDETDVARRVLEHMTSIDAAGTLGLRRSDVDAIEARASIVRRRAPFDPHLPSAPSLRERNLRHYLASFGIDAPPRLEPDRPRTDQALLAVLERIAQERPRPSLVYVFSPPPLEAAVPSLAAVQRKLTRRGVTLEWLPARYEAAIEAGVSAAGRIAGDAATRRARIARLRGERTLRAAGVKVLRARSSGS